MCKSQYLHNSSKKFPLPLIQKERGERREESRFALPTMHFPEIFQSESLQVTNSSFPELFDGNYSIYHSQVETRTHIA